MAKKEINPIVGIVIGVIVLGVIAFFGYQAIQGPQPRPGSYTPGVPPWMEKGNTGGKQDGSVHAPPAPATPGGQ